MPFLICNKHGVLSGECVICEERKEEGMARPTEYKKGDKVVQIYFPERGVQTVKCSYWQHYDGGSTSDYTVEFEDGGWDKSTNLVRAT